MNNTSIQAPKGQYLSKELIQRVAPSVFASEAHESRSDRYAYIPTIDVVMALFKEGFLPVMASQSLTRNESKRDFTKHMLRFRHRNDVAKTAVVGDTVNEVVLVNSHDGSSSYLLTAGVFRFVCSNGMIVPANLVGDIHVRHTGNIIDNVIEGSYRIIEDTMQVTGSIDRMKAITMTPDERTALSIASLDLRYGRDEANNLLGPITPDSALRPRRWDDNGTDLWSTFNVLQENLTKGGQHGRASNGNRATTRAINGIDGTLSLNKELWALADAFAQMKMM